MSNKESKARVANAFRAMKAIGIPAAKVKPVLKELLKLYDHNWKLIEEENYRALADNIFERDELEGAEQTKKIVNTEEQDLVEEEVQASQEPERPLKRLRLHPDCQSSTSKTCTITVPKTPLVRPKEEPDKLPDSHLLKAGPSLSVEESLLANGNNFKMQLPAVASKLLAIAKGKGKQIASPKASTLQESCNPFQPRGTSGDQPNAPLKSESRLPSHAMTLRDRGKGAVFPETPSKKRRQGSQHSSGAVCLKDPKENGHANMVLIKPKDEPITDDMLFSNDKDVQLCLMKNKSNGGDSSSRYDIHREGSTQEPSALQSANVKEAVDCTAPLEELRKHGKVRMKSCRNFSGLEIASSPSGEVRMFLNLDLAPGINGFHMPNLEAVIKSVEAKYLRLPKSLKPSISISNLLKETCECFLELGTDANSQTPKTLDVTQAIDSVRQSSASDARGAIGYLNGSVDFLCGARLPQSKWQVPHPIKDSTAVPQLSNMCTGDEIHKPLLTSEISRPHNDIVDIAKGEEKIVITVVNEVNNELPPSFCYIPQNAVFQNAYLNFCLARIGDNNCCISCSGDCLSSSIPCACTFETGGDFAYTTEGLVKDEFLKDCISMNRDPKKHSLFFCKECPLERSKGEDIIEPCKGHLVRKFIKECWRKCGCSKQCGNRVVQRGITRKLQVFMTPEGKGWGLRTLEDLPKGTFVCEYVGEVLTNSELFERVLRSSKGEKHSYPVLLDADWGAEGVLKDEEALCLDATYYGNVARFINHRCYDSTLVEIPVEVETPDHHYYHLAFFTTRDVKAMEELTWDYGIDFEDHEHPIKAFRCQCGSKFCRSLKRTTRSRSSRR